MGPVHGLLYGQCHGMADAWFIPTHLNH